MQLKRAVIDTETTGLEVWQEAAPFSVGMLLGPAEDMDVRYWEWQVEPFTREVILEQPDLKEIRLVCESERYVKVFHNAKFDIQMLAKIGIKVRGRVEDTHFAARVCNTLEFGFGLKQLTKKYCGFEDTDLFDLKKYVRQMRASARKKGWKLHDQTEADYWLCGHVDKLLPELPKKERDKIRAAVGEYCIQDVVRTALLWEFYSPMLDEDPCFRTTYDREIALLPEVMRIEGRGMAISESRTAIELAQNRKKADKTLKSLQKTVEEMGWIGKFNPASPKQLANVIYGDPPKGFGLECFRASKSGADSTDWRALKPHANHPFVHELFVYRSAEKACSTFFEKYADMMRPDPIYHADNEFDPFHDGNVWVIHPSLNQCGTSTGRFSCNNPNLQQVANSNTSPRGTEPIMARAPFGPRPGYRWYHLDYSQMELRVFAELAEVKGMLAAMAAGRDLNDEVANWAWGGPNNQYALEAAAAALELGSEAGRESIEEARTKFGWKDSYARLGRTSGPALEIAGAWLKSFDWDIVKAEKSVGKSASRARAKIVSFCKIYGGGPKAVIELLYCTAREGKQFWAQYDETFPEINRYIRAISSSAGSDGYIINLYGRKLLVEADFAKRAVNYMVQGSCADMMKEAIRKCAEFLRSTGLDAHIVMTIHDELIFEIREEHCYKWVIRELKRLMEDSEGRFRYPIPVEVKRCRERWDQKEAVSL